MWPAHISPRNVTTSTSAAITPHEPAQAAANSPLCQNENRLVHEISHCAAGTSQKNARQPDAYDISVRYDRPRPPWHAMTLAHPSPQAVANSKPSLALPLSPALLQKVRNINQDNIREHAVATKTFAGSVQKISAAPLPMVSALAAATHLGTVTQLDDWPMEMPRFDVEGRLTHFESAQEVTMTQEKIDTHRQAIDMHRQAMDFLEELGVFENPDCLQAIDALTQGAHQAVQQAPAEVRSFVLSTLGVKTDVAILLALSPTLYSTLENIHILKNYFSIQAPSDASDQRPAVLGLLQQKNITCPVSHHLTAAQIQRHTVYQAALAQLSNVEQTYMDALYGHHGADEQCLWMQANRAKKESSNSPLRDAVIAALAQHTRDYLKVLYKNVKRIANQDGGCIVPGHATAKSVEKEISTYLQQMDKKIALHHSGERGLFDQKKMPFSDLCDFFFAQNRLLPTPDFRHEGAIERLASKLDKMTAQASLAAHHWALDAVTQAFISVPDREAMDETKIAEQTMQAQTVVQHAAKKLNTTGEIPVFSGELEKVIETFARVGIFAADADSMPSSEQRTKTFNTSLATLKTVGLLTQPAYDAIMQAPEHIRFFLLQALELKTVLAQEIAKHPETINTLLQLGQAHHLLENEAPFSGLTPSIRADIDGLYPLNAEIIARLAPARVAKNKAYQNSSQMLEMAEQTYRAVMFFDTPEMPSLMTRALALKKISSDMRKIPELYQQRQADRAVVLQEMLLATGRYLYTAHAEIKRLERAGQTLHLSASTFKKHVKDYLGQLDEKIHSCVNGERHDDLFKTKITPFADVLKFLDKQTFLPEEKKSLYDAPNIAGEIQQTLRQIAQLAKEDAAVWLLAAGTHVLTNQCSFHTEAQPDATAQVELIRLAQQEFEQHERRALAQLAHEHATKPPTFFESLAGAIEDIMVANAEHDYGVAMNRYRYWSAYTPCTQSRSRGNDNPYFLSEVLDPLISSRPEWNHTRQATSNQTAKPNHSPPSQALMLGDGGRAQFDRDLQSRAAREDLRTILGKPAHASDREIRLAYRNEMRRCHPDRVINKDTTSAAQAARLNALHTRWQNR